MDVEIAVRQGRIRGERIDDVRRFLGMPYAAAPYGENRFRAPQPPPCWTGVRECCRYGPTALKPPQPDVFEALLPDPDLPGEDCLTVNIWTPVHAAGLPVLVWVHGGGYLTGSGAVPIYDGASFARHGVVCVTLNYRLGVDGFAVLPGRPNNRGLLDVIAALEWVRDNIAVFGGDPTRVTIGGQSAGAMAVVTVLSMPASAGLVHRAIAQSGAGHHALSMRTARAVTAALCSELGVETSAEALGEVGCDELLGAVDRVLVGIPTDPDPGFDEVRQKVMAFQPVIDGDSLPALPVESLAAGSGSDVDLLIGTNSDEFTLWSVPTGLAQSIDDAALTAVAKAFGLSREALDEAYPTGSAAARYSAVMTDWSFRMPALRAAEARAAADAGTFVYEFTWPSPLFEGRLGATHASEVAFCFDNLSVDWARELRGPDAPQALADDMHDAFVAFIANGDPGWPDYRHDRAVRLFGDSPEVANDPDGTRRRVWSGLR